MTTSPELPRRSRAMLAAVVLGSAVVSGGWLVEHGLGGGRLAANNGGARLFDQVYERVARDFVDTIPDSTLFTRAIDGLVGELHDPHSTYMSPQTWATLTERTSGHYAGVGAQIDVRDGWLTIVAPMPGGPALDAGILTGDRIIEVDGKPLRNITVEEAQKALRGTPGSVVRVSIERPGITTPLKFALTRRDIRVRSVQHASMLKDHVGYVALTIFSEESAPDLRRAIDSLRAAGMTSLIFDLRGDPGGLLDQGVGVADLFLDPGQKIVSMRGRTSDATRSFDDQATQEWANMPIVALVDNNSASAAEIVAGALQDHDRALIVGTTSYGKGSAQNVYPLNNGGAVKLTTALWYTPSGRSINRQRDSAVVPGIGPVDTAKKKRPEFKTDAGRTVFGGGGITPDVIVPPTRIATPDSALAVAIGGKVPQFRDALTDYALSLKSSKAVTSPDFVVTPAMRAELRQRMESRGIKVDAATYNNASSLIDRQLGAEIARYVFGDAVEYSRRLRSDATVNKALDLIDGAPTQKDLLRRASAVEKP